ncbi:uncharacterized protein LOC115620082 [Scaptodrosophila lebanonensis]|uniref:Uncharacterized protein LOC115620082 n=1 Tax=Drosophila lebanonensis TaxID=7225 RepID=A0A6J2SYX0_DROLE|nr:uncharacterized protein LOC115620082 [Scaptodrosophila lebanonensis]
MAFQRSYSKVWWGSDNYLGGSSFTGGGYYSQYAQPTVQPASLDSALQQQQQHQQQQQEQQQQPQQIEPHTFKTYGIGNLSCIQEVEDEQNSSKLSWHKHDSPGSLRSQDSGFSDNEESHSSRPATTSTASTTFTTTAPVTPNSKCNSSDASSSPTSVRSVATPPTVVRRVGNSSFYSPLVSVTRRISFSGASLASISSDAELEASRSKLFEQLDNLQLSQNKKQRQLQFDDEHNEEEHDEDRPNTQMLEATPPRATARRRKRVVRKSTQPLSPTHKRHSKQIEAEADSDEDSPPPPYNNETVYLGEAPPPYNNETVLLGAGEEHEQEDANLTLKFEASPLRLSSARFTASTSTPNARAVATKERPSFDVPLPFTSSVQSWLQSERWSCEQEVMCTLQTKSIAQEAYKNFTITTSAVAKLIRQLQQQSLALQVDFERNERVLSGVQPAGTLQEALSGASQLLAHLSDFIRVLERRAIFFSEARVERRRYEQHLEQIRIIIKDTGYSLERQHYINLESLLEDLQLLKRYTLITIRLILERLVRILVLSIEQSRCDLLLRANINMVATLMNIDYDGFASLTDAFVQNEAVRALLIIVLDHKLSSVRALALRALATLCCAPEAIAQLGTCGGIEIVRDILQGGQKRGDIERREAVSLLAQITAAWHGTDHRVNGLKDCAESLIAGLSSLLTPQCCPQTLLLCAAALNNLSRMEITSHYSIMSNEAIFKLIDTLEQQQDCPQASVFLYEQIVAMLHNMSLNKKCHSHLANGIIINFITSVYQAEFYKTYGSRAECESQRRSIKAILHTLTRLAQDSPALAAELLEQWRLPDLLQQSLASIPSVGTTSSLLDNSGVHSRDISQLARQLLHAHRQEQLLLQTTQSPSLFSSGHQTPEAQTSASLSKAAPASGLKFNLTRQESFV